MKLSLKMLSNFLTVVDAKKKSIIFIINNE